MDSAIPLDAENQEHIVEGKKFSKKRFLSCIGAHELSSPEMWRAAFTELVATACLLFTLTTAIISCLESHESKLLIPLAIFIIVFFLLLVTIPLTGGHLNPIFTFIAALKGVVTFVRAVFYMLAQCAGSVTAYLIMKSVMNHKVAVKYSLGGCTVDGNGEGISTGTALILEFSCTFLVLYVAVTPGFDKKRCKELGLTMICAIIAGVFALAVYVSITVTGQTGYGGVGLNPARCLGPALLLGSQLWEGHWVFWVGPFFACIVYHLFSWTLPREELVRADEESDVQQFVGASCLGSRSPANFQGKIERNNHV